MQQHGTHGIGSTFGARICARRSSCASRFAASVRGAASAPAQPTWITSSRIAVIGSCLFAVTICRAYAMHVTAARRPQKSRKLRGKNDCSLPPSYARARVLTPVCTGAPSQTRARKVDHLPPLGQKVLPRGGKHRGPTRLREKIPDRELRTVRSVSDSEERIRRQGTFRAVRSVSDSEERFKRQRASIIRAAKGKHHFGRQESFRTPGTAAGKGASHNGSTR